MADYSHPLDKLVSLKKQELALAVGSIGKFIDMRKPNTNIFSCGMECHNAITTIARLPGSIMSSSIFALREKINLRRRLRSVKIHP